MIHGYKGRFVGAGLTDYGRLYVLHTATARSESNRLRRAMPLPPDNPERVFIEHLKPETMTPEQLDDVQYHAIRRVCPGIAVVTNGKQTDRIAEEYFENPGVIEQVLGRLGYERDGTPRIAAVTMERCPKARFGIVAKDERNGKIVRTTTRLLSAGQMDYLATYTGEGRDIVLPDMFDPRSLKRLMQTMRMEGTTPQQLDDEFYGSLNLDDSAQHVQNSFEGKQACWG